MPNSKKKGNRGERKGVNFLKDWTGLSFQRVPQSGGLRWKKTDNITSDVICDTEGVYFPFSVEVKNVKEVNLLHTVYLENSDLERFWNQAMTDSSRAKGGKLPMLLFRYDRLPAQFFFIGLDYTAITIISNYAKFKGINFNYLTLAWGCRGMYLTTTTELLKLSYDDLSDDLILKAKSRATNKKTIKIKKR
jgi:Holliday junction resolvase